MAEKYRKKPIVVEATQWQPGVVIEGVMEDAFRDGPHEGCKFAMIHTLEGCHMVQPGDYIIKGIKGELYPCKPDIFAQTYEPLGAGDG